MKKPSRVDEKRGSSASTKRHSNARVRAAARGRTSNRDGERVANEGSGRHVVKVAIIGGGCAGLAAAWHLTRPEAGHAEEYDVTVYERSWRLGGKAASGRDQYGRIREHGIHIWLGFYENAFRMMRECYGVVEAKKWGPHCDDPDAVLPHGSFDDAFFIEPHVGVASRSRDGGWKVWTGYLPSTDGLPGTPLDERTNPFTLSAYLARALDLTRALMHSVLGGADEPKPRHARPDRRSTLDEALDDDLDFSFDPTVSPSVLVERMARLLRAGVLTSGAAVLQAVTIFETWLQQRDPAPQFSEGVLKLLEAVAAQTRKQLLDLVSIDEETRRKTEIIDLIMTIAVGLYRDRVLFSPDGLDAINDIDCKEWLLRHGAVKSSVESPFVTGLYDLAFCYERGDRARPALAAGQALRGALRMFFSYRGAPFWRLRSGMGETVFSPLFRVLKTRGVKFKFLHELSGITFTHDDRQLRVSGLKFARRDSATGFSDERPLDHFGCWRYESPAGAKSESVDLIAGRDFDAVVLAMGICDVREVCKNGPLMQNGQWQQMFQHVKTIATQAAQVWMTRDLVELGWNRESTLVSALQGPFETWADMTHTLAAERAWRSHPKCPPPAREYSDQVKSIAYFCGVLPDAAVDAVCAENPEGAGRIFEEAIRAKLEELLRVRVQVVWPAATDAIDFLADPRGEPGGTLRQQHVQANYKGSDRYTLALPGSLRYRISPLDYTVSNMTIAGDWTECGFNEGCVESAVMSGMLASYAISRKPDLDDIIGYNHP
jgi:uncharacterized protein with NAD-binding domain and iron-sulfur cluster